LPLWIKDVRECCALLHVNRELFPQDSAKYGQDGYGDYGNSDYSLSFGWEKEYAVNKNFEHDSENKDLAYNLSNGIASNPSKASHLLSANNEEMSLVSNLYIFMDKVKRDCLNLKNLKNSLTLEIRSLKTEKEKAKSNLYRIKEKEHSLVDYLQWFYNLKEVLWENYGIEWRMLVTLQRG